MLQSAFGADSEGPAAAGYNRCMQSRILVAGALALFAAACSGERAETGAAESEPAAHAANGAAVASGTAPPGAIVTLESSVPREAPPPENTVLMDQFGQQFLPGVLAVRVGQRVEFRSSEDVLHNVRVDNVETKAPVFNVATPPFESYTHLFDTPGYYQVSCDVHPAMRANIYVAATPHVTVADEQGAFTFPDVPVGSYTVRVIDGDRSFDQTASVTSPRTELLLQSHR